MSLCPCPSDRCSLDELDPRHGTNNGYGNLGCRCEPCRTANAAKQREDRARRATRKVPDHVHGTANGYGNWRCRCDACREGWRVDSLIQKHRRKHKLTDVAQGLVGPWTHRTEGSH